MTRRDHLAWDVVNPPAVRIGKRRIAVKSIRSAVLVMLALLWGIYGD